jgi:hypothetical protein
MNRELLTLLPTDRGQRISKPVSYSIKVIVWNRNFIALIPSAAEALVMCIEV